MFSKNNRLISFMIVVMLFALSLGACQPSEEPESSDKAEKVAGLFMGPVTDQSWNQLGYEGLVRAAEECGVEYDYTENVKQAEFEETMRNYAQQGYSRIICHSGTFTDAAKRVAPDFPDTEFIVSNAIEGNGSNMSGIYADYWQMGYLAGAVACQMTETNKVAVVAAERFPMIEPSLESFPEGAKSCGKEVETEIVVTGSFSDVNKAYESSVALIDQGVDVIWHQLDAADAGVYSAAEDNGIYTIGLYTDQSSKSPETVVASVFLSPTTQVYQAACGDYEPGEAKEIDITNGMENVMTDLMSNDEKEAIQQTIEDLESGEISR